jgi:hypothetical protein
LADLAYFTGFYAVSDETVTDTARAYADGKRVAFGRILQFLNLTPDERRGLEQAARAEVLAGAEET